MSQKEEQQGFYLFVSLVFFCERWNISWNPERFRRWRSSCVLWCMKTCVVKIQNIFFSITLIEVENDSGISLFWIIMHYLNIHKCWKCVFLKTSIPYVAVLYFLWFESDVFLWQRYACGLIRFRHNNNLLRIRKGSFFKLKYLFWSPKTQPDQKIFCFCPDVSVKYWQPSRL